MLFERKTQNRIGVCALALILSAATAVRADVIFDARGFNPNREFFSQLPYEHIDPLTGNLLLTFTELVLPGNAGFDLKIQRTYNSKIYNWPSGALEEDSWAGIGWTLHLGRAFNALATDTGSPVIEMPDGSRHQMYPHGAPVPSGCSSCYISKDFWIYDKSTSTLKLPNGVVYQFNQIAGTVRYATSIADPFGNTFAMTYKSDPQYALDTITQDLGSQSRIVTFGVDATLKSLSTMTLTCSVTCGTRSWTYQQTAATQVGFSRLNAVVPPVGPSWSYAYNTTVPPTEELTRVTTPNGGVIDYEYADKYFNIGTTYQTRTRVVTKRTTSGRDIVGGVWQYAYAQGTAQNQSVITTPCGTTTYTFQGVGNYSTGVPVWTIGLQQRRELTDGGTTLETEDFGWQASVPISSEQQIVGMNVDNAVFVPLLDTKTVTRGTKTYVTNNDYRGISEATFNDYGRPYQTTETGELTRTITRVFKYGFSGYIVDNIESETIAGTGADNTFTRSWVYNLSTGFVTSRSDYGVVTTFSPTARGNVAWEENARAKRTTYQYDWGRISSIATPEYTITRSINPDGTMQSETRRGHTTSYTYDNMFRPLTTNPPGIGLDIVLTYDNAAGTTTRTTRGTSYLETALDGFGRPSSTINSVSVRTDQRYDACGRRTYESFPFEGALTGAANIGTTMDYDALGRVTMRTFPDAKTQVVSYPGNHIDVAITDEESRVTNQDWSAYGDPDQAVLVGVTDARNHETTYTYNVVGSLRSVRGVGNRDWVYNTKNQLISETHPESGQTTYTPDEVGNVATRVDAEGRSTSFTYDGNNRVTSINHPGTAHDVTIVYDASDNRTSVSTSFVSTTFAYTEVNQVRERTDVVNGRTFVTTFTYDTRDNLQRMDYPSGRAVKYTHDTENRILTVKDAADAVYADTFSYHPSGGVLSYRAGNNLVHTQDFHPQRYWLQSVNSGGLLNLTYGYDGVGNVKTIDDSRAGFDQTFGYDAIDRLTSVTGWNPASFVYDAMGNRMSKTGPNATTYAYHAVTQRLSSATGAHAGTFTWDNTGNMLGDGQGTYTYTPDSMQDTATVGGVTTTYRYDGDQLRKLKLINGTPQTYFVHGLGGALLSEYEQVCSDIGPTRDYIYAGTRLIAAVKFPTIGATTSVTTAASASAENSSANVAVTVTTPAGTPLACNVTVQYATSNGTAVAGSDYTTASGSLTFTAGQASGTTQTVVVPVSDDALDEADETFALTIVQATGASVGVGTHTRTITDNDAAPAATIADVSVVEGDTTATATFTVTLSAASGQSVTVAYATANGTASAGLDYTAASGTLTFPEGTVTQTVTVPILGDVSVEPNEVLYVNLTSPVNVTLSDAQSAGTIVTTMRCRT